MVCFVCLDNNVLRACAECGWVHLRGTKALFGCGRQLGNRKKATDGDNRVATGVVNFVHTNTGRIFFSFVCAVNEQISDTLL